MTGSFAQHVVTLDMAGLEDLRGGEMYYQAHTADNPGGEIRGQLETEFVATETAFMVLSPAEQPTPVDSTAYGSAIVSRDGLRNMVRVGFCGW